MIIHFIQPAVPEYRVPFINGIADLYDIDVFCAKRDFLNVISSDSIRNIRYSPGFLRFLGGRLFWLKGLSLYKNYKKDDIVVINGNPRIINFMLLMVILRLRKIKFVWWGHGWSANSHGVFSKIRIFLMGMANSILVYTDKEKYKLKKNNCYALNNGIKLVQQDVRRERKRDKLRLVFIGRLTEKSNFKFLLDALSIVNIDFELKVIGSSDNILVYENYACEKNIQKSIKWYGPVFDEDKIKKIMCDSDFFIYPGSVGLSIIHAFNYSLPAIVHSNELKHMPEFSAFRDGFNGFSFKEENVKSLCEVLLKVNKLNSVDYNNVSNNSRATVERTYNTDDMVHRFVNMIKDML